LVKELQGDENLYITNYKKIEQLGKPKKDILDDYNEVKEQISNKYASLLDALPKPVAGILLVLMTLFVLYFRRKKEQPSVVVKPKEEKQKEEEKKVESRAFRLLSKLGDVALSSNENDEVVIEKSDSNNPNQQWLFTKANKQKEYFFIENLQTGKVIEIAEVNSNDGAKIILNKKKKRKNDHQEWLFEASNDKGYVFIVNKWAINVLDVKHKKIEDGTKVQSFHKKVRGTENQEWRVEKI